MSFVFLSKSKIFSSSYLLKYRTYSINKLIKMSKVKLMSSGAKQKTKYAPGTVTLQILGCGARGAPAAVYLFTDQSRYLFNCGEGTQRLAHEHKTKLSRLQHIFFTGKCWSKLGGLPGLALTAQDAGVTQLTLHGPPELVLAFYAGIRCIRPHELKSVWTANPIPNTLFQAMNRFIVIKKIDIQTRSSVDDVFEDEVMTVKSIPITGSIANESGEKECQNMTFMFVCKLKPKPGALDLKKCVERGVPPGPLLGLLKSGVDVTLDNGTIVKSADVSEPTIEDQTLVFVDVPSEDYLNSLESKFSDCGDASVVVHFAPTNIAASTIYQRFLSRFNKKTTHLFLNDSNRFSGYFAAHRIQIQLNQLNERIFPILGEFENIAEDDENSKRTKLICLDDRQAIANGCKALNSETPSDISSMTCFRLRPYRGLDRSTELKLSPDEYLKETQVLEGFTESLQNLNLVLESEDTRTDSSRSQFPKITFLGTGSCIPNKTRNVSAILLQPKEESFMLLDCGEGTLGQIIRFYGPTRWQNVVKNIKAIYISHLHADHHIGLIGILKERIKLFGDSVDPIYLFAPKQILPWLYYYNNVIEPIAFMYKLVSNGDMVSLPYKSPALTDMGIESISTCLVKHCPHSFGVSIVLNITNKSTKPFKITYSGDTMPCADLIDLGANSNILIHEATMEDELTDEARIKMHCTVSQALDVAQKMNAEKTILTHFSQRYAKLPRMPEGLHTNVAIAFDFMQVTVDDLKTFSLMYPVMKLMFSDHYEEMERKTQMRLIKSERKRKSNP